MPAHAMAYVVFFLRISELRPLASVNVAPGMGGHYGFFLLLG